MCDEAKLFAINTHLSDASESVGESIAALSGGLPEHDVSSPLYNPLFSKQVMERRLKAADESRKFWIQQRKKYPGSYEDTQGRNDDI
jgi:hypothetical protein